MERDYYQSEKLLKERMDQFEVAFDESSFDAFKQQLASSNTASDGLWKLLLTPKFGMALFAFIAVLGLGLLVGTQNNELKNGSQTKAVPMAELTKSKPGTTIENKDISPAKQSENQDEETPFSLARTVTSNSTLNHKKEQNGKKIMSKEADEQSLESTAMKQVKSKQFASEIHHTSVVTTIHSALGQSSNHKKRDGALRGSNAKKSPATISPNTKISALSRIKQPPLKKLNHIRPIVLSLLQKLVLLAKDEHFDSYVYGDVQGGLSTSKGLGLSDEFLESKPANSHAVRIALGYQWRENTALEIAYGNRDQSINWGPKEFDFTYFNSVSVHSFSTRLKNNFQLWGKWSGLSSLGYTFNFFQYQELGPVLGFTYAGRDQSQNLDYLNEFRPISLANDMPILGSRYSANYHQAEIGLGIAYQLNPRISLSVNATHFIGFVPSFVNKIDYVVGEGLSRQFEMEDKGDNTQLTVGLRYNFKHMNFPSFKRSKN